MAKITPLMQKDDKAEMIGRMYPEGFLPELSCEGTTYECGVMAGCAWKEALQLAASKMKSEKPWWKDRRYTKLISKYAPHLPDLFRGMACGADLDENMISNRAPEDTKAGCTSFAIAPEATLDGVPISGQSKDVPLKRGLQLLVLRMKMSDGMSTLTQTYPGWFFGHGFVKGGTIIFRNALFVNKTGKGMPYDIWGLLSLHMPTVEDVMRLTRDYGCRDAFHSTIADERGGIIGIENGVPRPVFLRPKQGIYTHANCVLTDKRMIKEEFGNKHFHRKDSLHRTERLRELLLPNRGKLTAQLAYYAMSDHEGYPVSLCRHENLGGVSASIAIAEPTKGLLHVSRGPVCQAWPKTYSL